MLEMIIAVAVLVVVFTMKSRIEKSLDFTGSVIVPFADAIKDTSVSASDLTASGRLKANDVLRVQGDTNYQNELARMKKRTSDRAKMKEEERKDMEQHDTYINSLINRNNPET